MKIALLGCGFVADYYMTTLPNHLNLELVGAYDIDAERLAAFCRHWEVNAYASFEEMLADGAVELVLNLTNPASHYATSRALLEAGKHVYSEKPLAMDLGDAERLVALAKERGLSLSGAPSSLLGEAPQAAWAALRSGDVGKPALACAEMEDGMVFRDNWRSWRSISGAPWPGKEEFEVGCTLEHAGYYLSWLCAFFGPVKSMTAFASKRFPDKGTGEPPMMVANDLSVTCLEHESGVVSRLTCGLVAARDRSLSLVGDTGSVVVRDGWDARSAVHVKRERWHPARGFRDRVRGALEHRLNRWLPGRVQLGERLRLRGRDYPRPAYPSRMDFSRGPAEQAAAIAEGRESRLSAGFVLHVTELALAIQNADRMQQPYRPRSRFAPVKPMPWA